MTTIRSVNDIPAALAASFQDGGLLVTEADLGPEFFDLRTGLASSMRRHAERGLVAVSHPSNHYQSTPLSGETRCGRCSARMR
jgi:hypothetical protein